MTDADLSTPIEELRLLDGSHGRRGYDVVIGSRALPGANIEVHQPWYRENMGRVFNVVVRLLLAARAPRHAVRVQAVHGRQPRRRFSQRRLDGFSFDVEALFIARRRGLPHGGGAGHLAQRRRHARGHAEGVQGLPRSAPDPPERLAGALP